MNVLHLNLKGEYFDAIKSGEKLEEYHLYNEYWQKRLLFKEYDGIVLKRGYPKRGDVKNTIERLWRGWTIKEITHPHFGPDPVKVFAVIVNEYAGNTR